MLALIRVHILPPFSEDELRFVSKTNFLQQRSCLGLGTIAFSHYATPRVASLIN